MKREFRVITVGIEEYDSREAWCALPGVAATASRIAHIFGAQPLPFPDGGTNREAGDLLKAIGKLPERSTLFLHWIGHGVTAGDQHYLICKDSPKRAALNAFEAIPSGELGRIIARSQAEQFVVVLDTCFSGEGAGNLARRYRENLASVLPREGWERVACVIATSHPLDKVVAGRFSEGLAAVLENPDLHLKWSRAEQYIDPERLTIAVKELLAQDNKHVQPSYEKIGLGLNIIPNPHYRPEVGNSDIETRRWLEGVFGDTAHFNLAARGIETGETGFFFSGRRSTQNKIIRWLNESEVSLQVVTGPPGSGKSALVGRIVTLSVPEVLAEMRKAGALADNDPIPPENAFDVSVYARGKTVFEVATSLGHAVGLDRQILDQPGIVDILDAVERSGKPLTIVIDALDEAAGGHPERIAGELIHPLAAMAHVRLLIGTRRSLDGQIFADGEDWRGRLRAVFGAEADILDLADEQDTQNDIAAFVARRLRATENRGSNAWIEEASREVAKAAGESFLFARLVARSLEATPDRRLDRMPGDAAEAFVQDIASRFPDDVARVTDMLRAMAFGLGLGLSRATWALVATCLSQPPATYTDDDIVWMLRNVGSYLVEATVTTDRIGQAVYRLIHQVLADHLQKVTNGHGKIVDNLSQGIEREEWLAVDPYLRRHLVEHALLALRAAPAVAMADRVRGPLETAPFAASHAVAEPPEGGSLLNRLLALPGVVAVLEPRGVLAATPHLLPGRAQSVAELYVLAAADLTILPPVERWALLHQKALMQAENDLAAALMPPPAAPWRTTWAQTRPMPLHLSVRGHCGAVTSIALGSVADQAVIVSGGRDGIVRRWNARTGVRIGVSLTGHDGRVTSIALGTVADQAVIVSGGWDSTVRRWDAETGAPIGAPLTGHDGPVYSVALGKVADRAVIVSGGWDGTVRRWDALTGAPIGAPLTGHDGRVASVVLGMVAGRTVIFSGGVDGAVRRWDAQTGAAIGAPIAGYALGLSFVAPATVADRAMIVTVGSAMKRWDAQTGVQISAPRVGYRGKNLPTQPTTGTGADEVLGFSDAASGALQRWDARTGGRIGAPLTGHSSRIYSAAVATIAGRTLIVSGEGNGNVRRWDTETAAAIDAPANGYDGAAYSVAFGTVAGQKMIASGGDDGMVRRWDAQTGAALGAPLSGHNRRVYSVALGTVAGQVVIVSGGRDGTVRRWNARTGVRIGVSLTGHDGKVTSIALGTVADRAVIVSGGLDGTVRRWDAQTGAAIGAPLGGREGSVLSVALGKVGRREVIVSGGLNGRVERWDAETGAPIGGSFPGHDGRVTSVVLGTVAGRAVICSGGEDRTVRRWDARTGAPIGAPLAGHSGVVSSVALDMLAGQAVIVSGGWDGTVRRWDARTGVSSDALPFGQRVHAVAFLAPGQIVAGIARGLVVVQLRG